MRWSTVNCLPNSSRVWVMSAGMSRNTSSGKVGEKYERYINHTHGNKPDTRTYYPLSGYCEDLLVKMLDLRQSRSVKYSLREWLYADGRQLLSFWLEQEGVQKTHEDLYVSWFLRIQILKFVNNDYDLWRQELTITIITKEEEAGQPTFEVLITQRRKEIPIWCTLYGLFKERRSVGLRWHAILLVYLK